MRLFITTVVAGLFPLGAMATPVKMQCVFDTECFETEECQAAAYGVDLTLTKDEERYLLVADTEAETMTGDGVTLANGSLALRLSSQIGPVMITIDPDGASRQSIHGTDAAMMINYTGLCEVR